MYSEKLTFEKEQYTHERKNEGETLSGTTHHFVKMLKPILRNNFYTY